MTKKPKKPTALSVTVANVMSWKPCGWDDKDDGKNYTKSRVRRLFAGRRRLTALDVLALEIPVEDRFWVVLREELILARVLRLFACDCADRDLARRKKAGETIRPEDRAAIETSRRYAAGKATLEELNAARDAAMDAAWDTVRTTARDAAMGAAKVAARAAAQNAAGGAVGYAARYAAWDAAGDEAGYAAWRTTEAVAATAAKATGDAVRAWQVARLRAMLKKEGY